MMRKYLDRMLRGRDVSFRYHKAAPGNLLGATGFFTTENALTQAEIDALKAEMAKKPELVDGEIVTVPRSRDRSPLKIW